MIDRPSAWRGFACGLVALGMLGTARGAEVERGEVLVGELNCAACHHANDAAAARLASAQSPVLGEKGRRLTPQWLRAYLRDPQASKPGTLMPDALHALAPAEKDAAAEALTHYLLSLQPTAAGEPGAEYEAGTVAKGRTLYHTVGCVACHAAEDPPAGHTLAEMSEVQGNGAPLGNLASKMTVPQLAAFLKNPLATWPSGRMPASNLGDAEATAIAMYLLRDQKPATGPGSVPGLRYEYYETALQRLPQFDRLNVKARGVTGRIGLDVRQRDDHFALRLTGNLTVPVEGEYTFFVVSDDGARLLIDDKEILANDGIHPATEGKGRIVLTRGEHALTLLYFNAVGERALDAYWQGPNFARQEIPAAALSHAGTPIRPTGTDPAFAVDAAKAERGRALFSSLNCVSCHAIEGTTTKIAARVPTPLDQLDPKRADACIAEHAGPGRPQYTLASDARDAIRTLLAAPGTLAQPLTPAARIEHTMTALNCYACHNRDGHGGPEGLRREYFTSPGETDLGDEGRFPPALNGVGAKLRPAALEAILWKAAVARPYMATRMPQFGQANVAALVPAFEQVDDPSAGATTAAEPAEMPNGAGFGRKLAGTGGLACIACHNFSGHPALGIPAIDMTLMYGRLKPAWFHRYLLDPQALRPGTRMPAFWPDGKASNHDILNGDTDLQIAALRQFLSKGKLAELPDGLVAAKAELVARQEAVIYRNFIQGCGPRAIGVGYPEKANLAFDADEDRVALIWQGAFIDAGRHRTGRAQGFEPPLGVNVVSWTPGAPFAWLGGPDAPWPKETGRAAGYRFRGYQLAGNERRPTFLYTFANWEVEDAWEGVQTPGVPEAGLRRTFTLHTTTPGDPGGGNMQTYHRAAVGDTIQTKPDGTFLVDKKVTLKIQGGGPPVIRRQGSTMELLVPLELQKRQRTNRGGSLAW